MYLRKGGKCLRKKSAEYLKCRNRFNENLKSIQSLVALDRYAEKLPKKN